MFEGDQTIAVGGELFGTWDETQDPVHIKSCSQSEMIIL